MATERPHTARRPSPALVIWSSIALFGVLFALLTYQLASSQPAPPRPVVVRKVLKRKVVTTIVPTPGAIPSPAVARLHPKAARSPPPP